MPTNPYSIKPLLPDDVTVCADIEADLFAGDSPWSAASFAAEISFPYNHYYTISVTENTTEQNINETAVQNTKIVGYGGIAHFPDKTEGRSEILTLGIAKSQQNLGLGKQLLTYLIHTADELHNEIFLEVRTDNKKAINLYTKLGFNIIGIRKKYYPESKADAYTMHRERKI